MSDNSIDLLRKFIDEGATQKVIQSLHAEVTADTHDSIVSIQELLITRSEKVDKILAIHEKKIEQIEVNEKEIDTLRKSGNMKDWFTGLIGVVAVLLGLKG